MTKIDFDAEQYEPLGSFEPLPLGEYTVVISASEMKDTKNKEGKYLQLVYDVVDDTEYRGRKVFDRLNLDNKNATAKEIAQRSLSSICRAVNVLHPTDSDELHNKPFVVKIGIRPGNDEFQATNVVKEYKKLDSAATPSSPKSEDKPSGSKKPWEKK
jgi:hypothetical protein